MYLRLNENEIIDSVCVIAAEELDCDVTEVDVKEIKALGDGNIVAHAHIVGRLFSGRDFDLEEICEGISQFLTDFHSFNPLDLTIRGVNHDRENGFWAEVTINE